MGPSNSKSVSVSSLNSISRSSTYRSLSLYPPTHSPASKYKLSNNRPTKAYTASFVRNPVTDSHNMRVQSLCYSNRAYAALVNKLVSTKGVYMCGGSAVFVECNFVPLDSVTDIDIWVGNGDFSVFKECALRIEKYGKDFGLDFDLRISRGNCYVLFRFVDKFDSTKQKFIPIQLTLFNGSVYDMLSSVDLDFCQVAYGDGHVTKTNFAGWAHSTKKVRILADCAYDMHTISHRLNKAVSKGFQLPEGLKYTYQLNVAFNGHPISQTDDLKRYLICNCGDYRHTWSRDHAPVHATVEGALASRPLSYFSTSNYYGIIENLDDSSSATYWVPEYDGQVYDIDPSKFMESQNKDKPLFRDKNTFVYLAENESCVPHQVHSNAGLRVVLINKDNASAMADTMLLGEIVFCIGRLGEKRDALHRIKLANLIKEGKYAEFLCRHQNFGVRSPDETVPADRLEQCRKYIERDVAKNTSLVMAMLLCFGNWRPGDERYIKIK